MSPPLMAAEMLEQPDVLARLAARFDDHADRVRAIVPQPLGGVVFVARGSSDNAAVYGRYLAELVSGRPAGLAAPSLLTLYDAPVDYDGRLVVALSQSGATPEIVTVCERLRSAGARTVAIVNEAASPLATVAEVAIAIDAGAERAVPATKTVTAQLLAVAAVAAALGPAPFSAGDLAALPNAVRALLADPAEPRVLAKRLAGAERLFVVARGLLQAAALEAALKIKETARIVAEGISTADFRHGPIAAVDRDVPVLAFEHPGPAAEDVRELVAELEARGARVARLAVPDAVPEALAVIPAVRPRPAACAGAGARPRAGPRRACRAFENHGNPLRRQTMKGRLGSLIAAAVALFAVIGLAACGSDDKTSSSTGGGKAEGKTIALLLPETKTTRYEAHDRPEFEAQVKRDCPSCKVIYANATQDPQKQQTQAESALTDGADVLALDAVDVKSAAAIVQKANQQNVPVIAYDRLIPDADLYAYVSFNNVRQGQIQAQTLVDKLGPSAKGKSIIMINGAPTDPSAGDYKKGAHMVLDRSGLKIAKEYDTSDWSPDKAQREMEQAITSVGKNGFVGVYSANDGMAGGAIAAMQASGIKPATIPITGGDAEVAAIQRILTGDQFSTIYLGIKKQAQVSADLAVAAAKGGPPPPNVINATVNNGKENVPSVLLTPVAVTKNNIEGTVVKDGFYAPKEICTGKYAQACSSAGLG